MTLSVHNVTRIEGTRSHQPATSAHLITIKGSSANGEPFNLSIFSRERLELQITEEVTESPDQGRLPL